jgi:hypothetical protein
MLCQAKKKVFPKKDFCVENKTKSYTSYLNFTESISNIKDKTKPVEFKCIFCSVTISVCIGATANVLTHLKLHKKQIPDLEAWLTASSADHPASNKTIIDAQVLKLVKFYVKSNSASSLFDDETFRDILSYSIPSAKTFTNQILPEVSSLSLNKKNNFF